jgi:PAS domain S-box-containing protein
MTDNILPLDNLQQSIAELERAELERNEKHLRLAQEAGEIGTWEWHLATGEMRWSVQMRRNLGLRDDMPASYETLLTATHSDDREQVAAALARFRERIGPMRIEARVVWPGEDIHWIVFLGRTVADEAERPVCMLGITIDGTRRRRIEEAAEVALRDSERRTRELNELLADLAAERARLLDSSRAQIKSIFDNSPDWLTLFRATSDGRFVYEDLNHATELAYGLQRDQVIGRRLEEILGVEQAQLPLSHMRACIATGENQHYTARRTMAGISRSIDVMFVRVPEKDQGDWLIMSTARDLTAREAMEQQLRQAQKMEAVGHLTGGVAHDFNNLLTAIIGNLELLTVRVDGDAVAARHLAAARRAAEHGAKLTEQLLAFSRRQRLQPRAIDLNAVVAGMREMLTRTIGTMIQVRTDPAPGLWPALVDPTQIEIAILNLAINSRDAMPLGGTLSIDARNLSAGEPGIPEEIGNRDCIRISVRDTGTGMTEEVLRSAVEPFFTTKEPGKGSGLGLSQVYGMAQQSNGAMRIESRPGSGTIVCLYLPRAAGVAGPDDHAAEGRQLSEIAGRVLVIDDDAAVREITVQMLRQAGYGVVDAESGQAALDALARGEIYDLVVIDVAMPGLSGIETIRRARERWPALCALYISGYTEVAGAEPQIGDDPMLQKPFRLSELTEAVRHAIKRVPGGGAAAIVPLDPRRARPAN